MAKPRKVGAAGTRRKAHPEACGGWELTPKEAVALQRRLAEAVDVSAAVDVDACDLVAATDVSFNVGGKDGVATVVVVERRTGKVVERAHARGLLTFPYVPGLLSFRELPLLLDAFKTLRSRPDVVICDGQGIAHPRRIGIASHLGLCLGMPTVGSAKSLLCGTFEDLDDLKGSRAPLLHRGEQIGYAVRTRERVAPIYVSPGHLSDAESAVALVLAVTSKYRIPDPIREAHRYANELRVATTKTTETVNTAASKRAKEAPTIGL